MSKMGISNLLGKIALVVVICSCSLSAQGLRFSVQTDANSAAVLDPRFYYFDDYQPNDNDLYVVDFLQGINAAYPELTELYDIGDAWMADQPGEHHRNIWVLRVTNEDPAYGPIEDKPAFFLVAGIHAHQVTGPELAIRYIKYMTEGYDDEGGYGVDPDVTWLVNHNVAHVLVMQNPDGHWKNEQSTSNYRRKNMDWDDGCSDPSAWGVDLDRNHSFMWACCGGSSGNPCDETYRGPISCSEPETQAFESYFAWVMKDRNGPNGDNEVPPAAPNDTSGIFISLHSYGDLLLWPWGWSSMPTPNEDELHTIGRKFAYYNGCAPSGDPLYTMDGTAEDWTYGKFGVPSFTFTVGPSSGDCGGFFPSYGCLDGNDATPRSFWAENKPAFLYAHKISRTPYITAYGPDTENVGVVPEIVFAGTQVQLTATIADHRYGADTLSPATAAEFFIGIPGEHGAGNPMAPADGSWGELSEEVTATVNTCGLTTGRHYIMIHGKNKDGDWGPFTAVFLNVETSGDIDCDGNVDMIDFAIFASAWQTEPEELGWNPKCNIGIPVDRVIDMRDLAVIIDNWLTGVE